MGLITLVLLLAFTVLYLSKFLKKKPDILTQVVEKITEHIDVIAVWGVLYGIIATSMTIIMTFGPAEMLLRISANVMIILMSLPFVFDRIVEKLDEKFHEKMRMNPAIVKEAKHIVEWVTRKGECVGYTGVVVSLLLFAVIFN
ncbi:MAG: hypothetical protein KAS59_10320 [Alphaproteobacteria bacterium]|nr:hypothetical protein [Alphaproteobacteria bacterium]